MIRAPAGPCRLLAVAAAMLASLSVAAAADRFVPADPSFVVADVRQSRPDDELRSLLAGWHARPDEPDRVAALAGALLERGRRLREPRYFSRAEALLAPRASAASARADLLRLHAETLQHRHAFDAALELLDAVIRENPHDGDARLRRATLRLTRGDFAGARADCGRLVSAGAGLASAGYACLAEALAGGGQLQRALALLESVAVPDGVPDPAARAYLLATRAGLRERAGDLAGAAPDYRAAAALAPRDEAIRAAWSDVLFLSGDPAAARRPLDLPNPGLALLVRQVALARGAERAALERRAREWLSIEAARGDAAHDREAALLALAGGHSAQALLAARRNFRQQRELADVRIYARAIARTGDPAARRELETWLRATNYQDAFTRSVLSGARPG
jgi:tetratricopeptide (TPR) repeat protein